MRGALRALLLLGVLFTGAVAYASPWASQADCEAAAGGSLKTKIDGLDDTDFIGRVVYELDQFWRGQWPHLSPSALGLTQDSLHALMGNEAAARYRVQAKSEYSDVRVKIYDRDIQLAGQTAHDTETPFYYPGDQTIYLTDDSIKTRIRGYLKKDVEWAFVLAHETGHHVQFQMGLLQMLMQNRDDVELNTRLELQADCLAGYWIGRNRELFGLFEVYEPGRLAGRVGSRNHGTSSQRRRWYLRGFKASSISQCNTLSVPLERL